MHRGHVAEADRGQGDDRQVEEACAEGCRFGRLAPDTEAVGSQALDDIEQQGEEQADQQIHHHRPADAVHADASRATNPDQQHRAEQQRKRTGHILSEERQYGGGRDCEDSILFEHQQSEQDGLDVKTTSTDKFLNKMINGIMLTKRRCRTQISARGQATNISTRSATSSSGNTASPRGRARTSCFIA
jgi:hypothetical protein